MVAKLYVGNISYKVSSEELFLLFAEVGTVLATRVIFDQATGRSKGFGFVEMASVQEAEVAIDRLRHYNLCGRSLVVHLAHDDKNLNQRIRSFKMRQFSHHYYINLPARKKLTEH